jgi:hypothetical protein
MGLFGQKVRDLKESSQVRLKIAINFCFANPLNPEQLGNSSVFTETISETNPFGVTGNLDKR